MKFYIETWKPKQIWLDMSQEQRMEYMEKLGPAIQMLTAQGAEIIGWGKNDRDTHNRSVFDFFAIWKFPNDELAKTFENIVADGGWYDYFEQQNMQGSPTSPNDITAQLINI